MVSIPTFLYGTAWKEERTEGLVREALGAGFRGIDTANQRKHYHEAGAGAALVGSYEAGVVTRGDLFLQTKFTSLGGQDSRLPYDANAPAAEQVAQSFARSLEHLHTDYVDSYVLHGPSHPCLLTDEDWEVWGAMEALHAAGKAKVLGASNVSVEQVEALYKGAKVKPVFVQNRCYAQMGWDAEVREVCRREGIVYQGFSLLTANAGIFRNARFHEIKERVGCTAAQLVFRFAQQVGMLPLTGTTDAAHMREDLACGGFTIEESDVKLLERIALL